MKLVARGCSRFQDQENDGSAIAGLIPNFECFECYGSKVLNLPKVNVESPPQSNVEPVSLREASSDGGPSGCSLIDICF